MRVMIDTNVIISAILNPQGTPKEAFSKAADFPFQLVLCNYIKDEVFSVFLRKFPKSLVVAESFFAEISAEMNIVSEFSEHSEALIRDVKDRPILRAAIQANVDILVTGDKDFLDSGITKPRIMTASEFLYI